MKSIIVNLIFFSIFLFGCTMNSKDNINTDIVNLDSIDAIDLINNNINNNNFVIIDLRTNQEFLSGHIKNAINIDYYDPNFKSELDSLDKNKEYLIYCRSGSRSRNSIPVLQDLGFTKIYHLNGGLIEWTSVNLPIVN